MYARRCICFVLCALLTGLAGLVLTAKSQAETAGKAHQVNAFGQTVSQLAHQEAGRGFGQEVSRMAHLLKEVLGAQRGHEHGRWGQHFTRAFLDTLALLEQLEEDLEQLLALERALAHSHHHSHHRHGQGLVAARQSGTAGEGASGGMGMVSFSPEQRSPQDQSLSRIGRRTARAERLRNTLPGLCCCLGEHPININIDIFFNNNTNISPRNASSSTKTGQSPQQPAGPAKPLGSVAVGGSRNNSAGKTLASSPPLASSPKSKSPSGQLANKGPFTSPNASLPSVGSAQKKASNTVSQSPVLNARGTAVQKNHPNGPQGGKRGSNSQQLVHGKGQRFSVPGASRVGQALHTTLHQQIAWHPSPRLGMTSPRQGRRHNSAMGVRSRPH